MSTSESSRSPTITIIGGGLAGVIFAIGLSQRNVPFHIFEAAANFGEIGAGIAFGPNSTRALNLISPELLAAYNRHATCNESPGMESTFVSYRRGTADGGEPGDLLFHLRGGERLRSGTGLPTRCCVHRARFLDEIVGMLPPGSTTFGKSLESIQDPADDDPLGDYILRFADGTTVAAAVIVGCDGIKSATRLHIYGKDATPTFQSGYGYRALVPRPIFEAALGHERTADGQLYVGPGSYILSYPIEKGTSINLGAFLHRQGTVWTHSTWQAPTTEEEMRKDLDIWDPKLVDLLTRYGTRNRWALFDNMRDEPYFRDRICLLGDSAHATTPHMGAGAGMAVEGAYVLSSLMSTTQGLQDVVDAFHKYDSIRRPRTQEVIRLSRRNRLTNSFLDEGVGNDVAKMEHFLSKRYTWLWDEDLEKMVADSLNAPK